MNTQKYLIKGKRVFESDTLKLDSKSAAIVWEKVDLLERIRKYLFEINYFDAAVNIETLRFSSEEFTVNPTLSHFYLKFNFVTEKRKLMEAPILILDSSTFEIVSHLDFECLTYLKIRFNQKQNRLGVVGFSRKSKNLKYKVVLLSYVIKGSVITHEVVKTSQTYLKFVDFHLVADSLVCVTSPSRTIHQVVKFDFINLKETQETPEKSMITIFQEQPENFEIFGTFIQSFLFTYESVPDPISGTVRSEVWLKKCMKDFFKTQYVMGVTEDIQRPFYLEKLNVCLLILENNLILQVNSRSWKQTGMNGLLTFRKENQWEKFSNWTQVRNLRKIPFKINFRKGVTVNGEFMGELHYIRKLRSGKIAAYCTKITPTCVIFGFRQTKMICLRIISYASIDTWSVSLLEEGVLIDSKKDLYILKAGRSIQSKVGRS